MDEIKLYLDEAKEKMDKAISHLEKEFVKIRAGRANPSMLASVQVDYYGSQTPLSQIANINTPDAMTLSIQPWERNLIQEIEKAIINANLGFAPSNNGESVIINIPPLTEERRKELAKIAKSEAEDAKVGVRNARKDANNSIKAIEDASDDLKKNAEADVQALTDKYVKKVDEVYAKKETEILTV